MLKKYLAGLLMIILIMSEN